MRAPLCCCVLLAAACGSSNDSVDASADARNDMLIDAQADAPSDTDSPDLDASNADTGPVDSGMHRLADEVDVLFVIDNRASMSEEQNQLAIQMPRLARILAQGDLDNDGEMDFRPVPKIRFGVISSDMGVMGATGIASCTEPMHGDDGVLRTMGDSGAAGCMASYDPYLSFDSAEATSDPGLQAGLVAQSSSCVVRGVGEGCLFQSPLEAALKALMPASVSESEFFGETSGHGGAANFDFVNPNAVIVIVVLTNEDDCSVSFANAELYSASSSEFEGELNERCALNPNAMMPTSRYQDGLQSLRDLYPDRVIFGAITGIPADLVTSADANYTAILADARMTVSRAEGGSGIAPACTSAFAGGNATPGRRLVETAESFAPNSFVASICATDYVTFMAARIAAAFPAS